MIQATDELRDKFAMAAMAAIVSEQGQPNRKCEYMCVAESAWRMADAMLALRESRLVFSNDRWESPIPYYATPNVEAALTALLK